MEFSVRVPEGMFASLGDVNGLKQWLEAKLIAAPWPYRACMNRRPYRACHPCHCARLWQTLQVMSSMEHRRVGHLLVDRAMRQLGSTNLFGAGVAVRFSYVEVASGEELRAACQSASTGAQDALDAGEALASAIVRGKCARWRLWREYARFFLRLRARRRSRCCTAPT